MLPPAVYILFLPPPLFFAHFLLSSLCNSGFSLTRTGRNCPGLLGWPRGFRDTEQANLMPEEPQAGSGQHFSQAGLQLGCVCRNRSTLGMGASKASFPGACWLSMGSWKIEEKAREKIIPAEMCSAPTVGLRGPRGMDTCPSSPFHPCTRAVHLQIFMGLLQRCSGMTSPTSSCDCTLATQSHVPQATHPGWFDATVVSPSLSLL